MTLNNSVKFSEEKTLFQIFFLKDVHAHSCTPRARVRNLSFLFRQTKPHARAQDAKVLETTRIPFTKIRQRLEQGESILITPEKEKQPSVQDSKDSEETVWYFTHI